MKLTCGPVALPPQQAQHHEHGMGGAAWILEIFPSDSVQFAVQSGSVVFR